MTEDPKKKMDFDLLNVFFDGVESQSAEMPSKGDPRIGEMVEGEGIYIGRFAPKAADGRSLGKVFKVYAAPEDMPVTATYEDMTVHVAGLESWHGHNGWNASSDRDIYRDMLSGIYKGQWVIPPLPLLTGKDINGRKTSLNSLFGHAGKGALAASFNSVTRNSVNLLRYWSSTKNPSNEYQNCIGVLSSGDVNITGLGRMPYSCRPVRFVEAKP